MVSVVRVPRHQVDGRPDAPVLVLGPSIGTTTSIWQGSLPTLTAHYRVVRWDLPGHGGGDGVTTTSVRELAEGVVSLADRLGAGTFDYAGASLGGAVGLYLAAHHGDRLRSLAMVCSAPRFGDPAMWRERAALVRERGVAPIVEGTMKRWFTPEFRAEHPDVAAAMRNRLRDISPAGYAACCDALATCDLRDEMANVRVPTLIVAGERDPAAPPDVAEELADGIPGARLVMLSDAAHLANVQQPARVTAALLEHLRLASEIDPSMRR